MADRVPRAGLLEDLTRSNAVRGLPDAEELAAQTITEVLERFPDLPDDRLERMCFTHLRYRALRERRDLAARRRNLQARAREIGRAEPEPDPLESADERELRQALHEAVLSALDEEERWLVHRHFVLGMTQVQLASELGVSVATVSRRIAQSVSRLGRALGIRDRER